MKRQRIPLPTLWTLLAAAALAPALLASEPSRVVGDATGDGAVDFADLRLVEQALADAVAAAGPDALADVAAPCDRELTGADLARLKKAVYGLELGLPVTSDCHGQAIGTVLPEPPPAAPETLDEVFLAIAAEVPEFGGLYFDGEGVATVVLTDLAAWSAAEAAVFARFSHERLGTDVLQAVEGRFGFAELHGYRVLARDFLTLPGVFGLDADEVANRLRIAVDSAEAQDAVVSALGEYGIPGDAVEVVVAKALESFETPYQEHRRPMRGGIKLGGGCTAGPIVERQGTRGYLTNAHCTPTFGVNDGVTFFQPSNDDPSFVAGTEAVDPPLLTSADDPRCPAGAACRWSDSVFVATTFDTTTRKGSIQSENPAWHYRKVEGKEHQPLCGETVSKSGQKTGQTFGEITHSCYDLSSFSSGVFLLCQYVVDMAGAPGDSGAPVFVETYPDTARLYGMVWGGKTEDNLVGFSGVNGLESELGWLDVDWGGSDPEVEWLSPGHGASLGTGSFFDVELAVRVQDHEDGADCAGCSVDFSSTADGFLGTEAVIEGLAVREVLLSGPGYRLLYADATDASFGFSSEWSLVSTGNAPPEVWIDFPVTFTQVAAGVDAMFAGGSFDPEIFSALPCSSLSWRTDVAGDPAYQGCTPIVRFDTPGMRDLTLTGTDGGGEIGTAVVRFEVLPAETVGPPYVTILEPASGAAAWRTSTVDLVGKAKDPEGQSPIQYEWRVRGPHVAGGEAVLGTASGPDDEAHAPVTWSPAEHVYLNCGGSGVELELRATDAAGDQSSVVMPFTVVDGPC